MMMDDKKEKKKPYGKTINKGEDLLNASPYDNIKLFDNFDWAALGIAACGVVLLIAIITGNY
jgi:hypothetical protein